MSYLTLSSNAAQSLLMLFDQLAQSAQGVLRTV